MMKKLLRLLAISLLIAPICLTGLAWADDDSDGDDDDDDDRRRVDVRNQMSIATRGRL